MVERTQWKVKGIMDKAMPEWGSDTSETNSGRSRPQQGGFMQMSRLSPSLYRATQLISPDLSAAAKTLLQALNVWQATGDWRLAARIFGLSRATLFR
jgi:hypothetical protein